MRLRSRVIATGAACAATLAFTAVTASAQPVISTPVANTLNGATSTVGNTVNGVQGAVGNTLDALGLPRDGIKNPNDHTMGSQIRKVEDKLTSTVRSFTSLNKQQMRAAGSSVRGIDVSAYQGDVNWASQWNAGKRFAWVKATESTTYTNPYFAQQYNGSYNQGFIRGAYHFATPDTSSGATQAKYFLAHGGGWSPDGKTLPGALDMEYNPYGSTCYGLSQSQMTQWIKSFSDTYHAATGKYPAIYTSTSWWNQCVGGTFSTTNPLWVARYNSSVGALPRDWGNYTVWQYSSSPIDQDVFNGSGYRLQVFATMPD